MHTTMRNHWRAVDSSPNATSRRRVRDTVAIATAMVACIVLALRAQPAPQASQLTDTLAAAAAQAEPSGDASTLTFFNRPIAVLRARVMGRGPGDRVMAAEGILGQLVEARVTGPVAVQTVEGGALITVGLRPVFGLVVPDIDPLSGETLDEVTRQALARLQQALDEAGEAHRPAMLLRAAALSLGAVAAGVLALWAISRFRGGAKRKIGQVAEKTVAKTGLGDAAVLRATRVIEFERRLVNTVALLLQLAVVYVVLTFVLRRFPYTRPWGESMRGFLLDTLTTLGLGVAHALPGLFTVAVILLIARITTRVIAYYFRRVEEGGIEAPPWMYRETAQPTRRLLTALIWAFAIVVAYPYLPGSETDAFKGVSVFLGLMFTLGSAGIVQHVMSGFMITYSRALRIGDFVKIGEVEGTVTHLGILSTKVRTPRREEITIPNAVVTAQTTIDYTRFAQSDGVMTPTSVTIGYDAPWRQVEALLLAAAERTPGVRRDPKPIVLQAALEDFYVKYVLLVCLEQQDRKALLLHQLHANIQDLFNEHGVQIMSPNYEADPAGPKIVAKKDWYAAPAAPPAEDSGSRLHPVKR
jgi:small-conductance mechanosensitive channel